MCSTGDFPANPPSRRTRTKRKKPKFLSLRRVDHQYNYSTSSEMRTTTKTKRREQEQREEQQQQQPQLNLFPLHPENLFQEEIIIKEAQAKGEGYYLLGVGEEEEEEGGEATLAGLLQGQGRRGSPNSSSSSSSSVSAFSASVAAYGTAVDQLPPGDAVIMSNESLQLARAALRQYRERDTKEEKWVAYSDVATEVVGCVGKESSRCSPSPSPAGLSLKLDYEQILNAWSDKAPLYIQPGDQAPQMVPDLQYSSSHPQGLMEEEVGYYWRRSGEDQRMWLQVPDQGIGKANNNNMEEEGQEEDEGQEEEEEEEGEEGERMMNLIMGQQQREARVMRYKEKRHTRLFSKRIRYEVRKLNAEKRPRMKGRFVKRKAS
ncbi:hypothetical protein H6P81_011662 [Aristolochia fimbriata]|uniref:CCT domain-containing protein n=1 Tax=Aristolochia fimbriata TaxID=158543 RepID=A0AAV7E9Z1_ARIFI|nr:hypothetical protein H6P81_011662 [Aristolochia fimbriata]